MLKVLLYWVGKRCNQNKTWQDIINASIKQTNKTPQMNEQNKHTNKKSNSLTQTTQWWLPERNEGGGEDEEEKGVKYMVMEED